MAGKNLPIGAGSVLANTYVMDVCKEVGTDPIRFLAMVVNGQFDADIGQRISAAKELATYIHPKQKVEEPSKKNQANITYNIVTFGDLAPDEANALRAQGQAAIDNRPKSKAEVLAMRRNDIMESAVMLEAMRGDVEKLVVDETGIQVEDWTSQ